MCFLFLFQCVVRVCVVPKRYHVSTVAALPCSDLYPCSSTPSDVVWQRVLVLFVRWLLLLTAANLIHIPDDHFVLLPPASCSIHDPAPRSRPAAVLEFFYPLPPLLYFLNLLSSRFFGWLCRTSDGFSVYRSSIMMWWDVECVVDDVLA